MNPCLRRLTKSIDHWQDVLTGSLLGLSLAYFSYRQYYPSLASETSHRPYAPRVKRDGPMLPTHRPILSSSSTNHELGSPQGFAAGYRDAEVEAEAEELGVPEGTEPRPERANMASLWKDDEEVEVVGHE